jgi:site-specific DNA-methyltransferase (adenine-specific)
MNIQLASVQWVQPFYRFPMEFIPDLLGYGRLLRKFGFGNPIIVEKSGTVILGHIPYFAAVESGFEEIPVHVPVALSSSEIIACRLADDLCGNFESWQSDPVVKEVLAASAARLDDYVFLPQ